MSLNIKRAFAMTFTSGKWFEKLLIGAVIWLAAMIAARAPHIGGILNFAITALTAGYAVRLMRTESTATAETVPTALPEWGNWGELFKQGLLLSLVNLIYGVVFGIAAFALLALFGASGMLSQIASGPETAAIPAVVALIFLVLGLSAVVLYVLVIPMAAAHYAHTGRFGAAFQLGTILHKLFSRPVNVLLILGMSVLAGVTVVIASVTVVLLPFALFAAQVVLANLWAQAYRLAE